MSPISVRGFAVASATAVTAVGSVVGVASGSTAQTNDAEATAAETTLLADIPAGQQAQVQTESLSALASAAMARQMVPADQFQCFSNIVDHESSWNYRAVNPSSGAYGLFQALPGSKMSSVGADWQTNPATQIKWGLNYMNERYDSPCGAWSFWQANHWY